MATVVSAASADAQRVKLEIIDTDVHHGPFDRVAALGPYLTRAFRQRLSDYGIGTNGDLYAMNGGLRGWRADMLGGVPHRGVGAVTWDEPTTRKQLLDGCGVDIAMLTGGIGAVASALPDVVYGVALVRAFNEWTRAEWLDADPRYRMVLQVCASDPVASAAEIDRFAEDPRVSGIVLGTSSSLPYGHRFYQPIHEACARHRLPITLHLGGTSTRPTPAGYPSYYIESRFARPANYAVHLTSFIMEGVFERLPSLKVCSIESGINWVPAWMQRMDAAWRLLGDKTPWVRRPPSTYVREHIRFSSQPLEEPETKEGLLPILQQMEAGSTLMFSSDYPHFDWDDPKESFNGLDEQLRRRIFSENARATYRI
jgi:predicted TIM-barrel fold metal-dependent hydrolase